MRALLIGALLGLLLVLWPSTLQAAASVLTGQTAVLAFILGVLARPALAGRWSR
ncbi:hypothetical protein TPA0906_34610 [Streptomyces olivaceus]|uniref:hypothetical protein n=1 Tax=Streptomyces olivaceus TaxID=47716 RepID=UPI0022ED796D|nr:hypothetical protein [Streptomyces olivaceus]GHJ01596.1 hypothetical protein TPA0906_34610 [Streptomyces olivaceus]